MASIRVEEWIAIERGVDAVFDAVADPRTWQKLEPDVAIRAPTTIRTGSRISAMLEINGAPQESQAMVTVHEPPRRFGVHVSGPPFNAIGLVSLDGTAERTRLSAEVELTPSSWIHGLTIGIGGRFLKGQIAKIVRHKLDELKVELERGA